MNNSHALLNQIITVVIIKTVKFSATVSTTSKYYSKNNHECKITTFTVYIFIKKITEKNIYIYFKGKLVHTSS